MAGRAGRAGTASGGAGDAVLLSGTGTPLAHLRTLLNSGPCPVASCLTEDKRGASLGRGLSQAGPRDRAPRSARLLVAAGCRQRCWVPGPCAARPPARPDLRPPARPDTRPPARPDTRPLDRIAKMQA